MAGGIAIFSRILVQSVSIRSLAGNRKQGCGVSSEAAIPRPVHVTLFRGGICLASVTPTTPTLTTTWWLIWPCGLKILTLKLLSGQLESWETRIWEHLRNYPFQLQPWCCHTFHVSAGWSVIVHQNCRHTYVIRSNLQITRFVAMRVSSVLVRIG